MTRYDEMKPSPHIHTVVVVAAFPLVILVWPARSLLRTPTAVKMFKMRMARKISLFQDMVSIHTAMRMHGTGSLPKHNRKCQ